MARFIKLHRISESVNEEVWVAIDKIVAIRKVEEGTSLTIDGSDFNYIVKEPMYDIVHICNEV